LKKTFGFWQRLFQTTSLAGHCNKVGQDISTQVNAKSCPGLGQVGEDQEEIYYGEERGRNHWKHTFGVVLV